MADRVVDTDKGYKRIRENLRKLAKASTGDGLFTFEVDQFVTVYVAFDEENQFLPEWTRGWTRYEETLMTDTANPGRRILSKNFPPGTVTLGGNLSSPFLAGAGADMYTVIVGPMRGALTSVNSNLWRQYK